ncbi:MAG TPA: hypothetical protein VG839_00795, partial [Asticcacaulis sp.]|nr:hypothetical protein [Asticcacaulis sp.]
VQGYLRAAAPELRFWALFAVIFALVAQGFFPAQVMARPGHDGPALVFCTGNDTPVIDASGKITLKHKQGVNGLKCADCVLASLTAVQASKPAAIPVVYTVMHVAHAPSIAASPVKARAPPRPFSCGPPVSLSA